jgi:transposase
VKPVDTAASVEISLLAYRILESLSQAISWISFDFERLSRNCLEYKGWTHGRLIYLDSSTAPASAL